MSQSIKVRIERREEYDVTVGMHIWDQVRDYFKDHYSARKLFIAVDSRVYRLHGEKIEKECSRYFNSLHVMQIPEGEKSKSTGQWKNLQDELLAKGVERSTPLLAIGGGVTGDLAGFAAASVLRGIPLIHMPTSLLAMVDSSIGGKTGVNHAAGKNLIGAFYQPDAVFADLQYLETLERPEWIGGLAEMLKYAAIRAPEMFDALKQAVEEGFAPSERWAKLIHQSAAIKIDFVQQDVHEAGRRACLNFGHTFGHALEKLAGYGNISHGEAVFTGMLAAIHVSRRLGAPIDEVRFAPFNPLYDVNLPGRKIIPDLVAAMKNDKKVKEGKIRLILLNEWGTPYIKEYDNDTALGNAWESAFDALS